MNVIEPEFEDPVSGDGWRDASEEDQREFDPDGEGQEHDDDDDYAAAIRDLAQALMVTTKKLKAAILGRGWTKAPRPVASSCSKSSAPSGTRVGSTPARTSKSGTDKSRDMAILKQKHPCFVCGELGHGCGDKDDAGRPQCRMHSSSRHVRFADVLSSLDHQGSRARRHLLRKGDSFLNRA